MVTEGAAKAFWQFPKISESKNTLQYFFDALYGLLGGLPVPEGGEADIALPAGAKARAGGGDHTGLLEQAVKEIPRRNAIRGLGPNIGGVNAAVNGKPCGAQPVLDDLSIVKIEADGLLDLLLPLWRKGSLCGPLDHIGHPVEFSALTAAPEGV